MLSAAQIHDRKVELLSHIRDMRRARDSMVAWARICGFEPARHHVLICEALEALETGEIQKLALFLPPGSAKSTYGSILFPPWFMARNPRLSVLAASHSEDLAERWSRRVRNLIDGYPHVLNIALNADARAVGRWQLAGDINMAEYQAAGAGSAIAGFRADLGLMDDLIRGREQALSEDQRKKLVDWYTFDFVPRLKPNARQVLISTRWHEDDINAFVIAQGGWFVINIPMEAEALDDPLGRPIGARLWPEWFTDQMVEVAKRDPVLWNSLYQQRPTQESGTFWKRDWLHPVARAHVPDRKMLRVYGGSDYAVSADKGDYTVHATVGLDPEDRPWLLDLWRQRTTSDVWVNAWCEMVLQWKPMSWGEEHGQIISGVGPWLEREILAKKAYTDRQQFVSRLDKGTRAQSMRGLVAARGLWYDEAAPWRGDMEAELLSFPVGKHDDITDALGLAGQLLDVAIHGKAPKEEKPKPKPGYKTMGSQSTSNRFRTL